MKALKATIAKVREGIGIVELDDTIRGLLKEAGHGQHILGPPIHGVGVDFEAAPPPPGDKFFHGEKESPSLSAGVVKAIGNCGIYTGPWSVGIEDTVVVGKEGPIVLADYPYSLEHT